MACRVLIVDDDDLLVELLRLLLDDDARIDVVGRARTGAEAVELVAELRPDAVTMDIDMPVMDGVQATRRIAELHPEARVVIVTGSAFHDRIEDARSLGAAGYVSKARAAKELADAIATVCRTDAFVEMR